MRVQRLVMPVTSVESWTVLDDDLVTVEPAERFLAHLSAIERSPNTVRAYAHSLALWFAWLGLRSRAWDAAKVEDISEFVRWPRAPADNVIVLDVSASRRSEATVNRHLAAVFAFYDFHARAGVKLADSLVAWRRVPRGSYKPFLHHVTGGRPVPTRPVKLKAPRRLPGSLTVADVTTILAACTRLRDRFLIALLAETGMRIGQALGLRHTDFVSRRREVVIVPRDDNANGARAKSGRRRRCRCRRRWCGSTATTCTPSSATSTPTTSSSTCGLHRSVGRCATRPSPSSRLRTTTGVAFTPHLLRHTRATELIRAGVPIAIVSKMLTHRSVATTSDTYVHLTADDVRAELVRAGVWDPPEDR